MNHPVAKKTTVATSSVAAIVLLIAFILWLIGRD